MMTFILFPNRFNSNQPAQIQRQAQCSPEIFVETIKPANSKGASQTAQMRRLFFAFVFRTGLKQVSSNQFDCLCIILMIAFTSSIFIIAHKNGKSHTIV